MYRKNITGQNLGFVLISASTGAALTGATVTAYRSIDGGTQAAVTGTIAERGNGQYNFAPSAADLNGNQVSFLFTATGAIPAEKTVVTTAADPTDAQRLGLTALPATGTLAVKPAVTLATADVTGNLPANVQTTAASLTFNLTGNLSGSVGSVTGAVGSVTGAVGSVTGNLGGNVTGSVGSVTGAVGSVTGAVASVTGAVGSVTGNVGGSVGSLGTQAKLDVNAEADTALADYDAPTNAEMVARTIVAADYATATALGTVDDFLDTEVAAILAAVDTEVAAIKAKTDNLPASPAAVGSAMTLAADAVTAASLAGDAVAEIQAGLATPTNITAGTITTATNVTTVNGLAANVITAASIATDAGTEIAVAVRDVNNATPAASSLGAGVNSAASAGDPWSTLIPGAYAAGTAGYIVGINLDAPVSTAGAGGGGGTSYDDNLHAGTALDGSASTITLAADAPAYDLAPDGEVILYGGIGRGQSARITTYDTGTKVATIDPPWIVTPDATTTYAVYRFGRSFVGGYAPGLAPGGGGGGGEVTGYAAGQDPETLLDARLDAIDAAILARTLASAAYATTVNQASILAAIGVVDDYIDTEIATITTNLAGVTTSVATLTTNVAGVTTNLATVATNVSAILDDTGTAGVVMAPGSKAGFKLASDGVDLIVVESGLNLRQASSIIAAGVAGLLSGADTGTYAIKGAGVATTRISGTTNGTGRTTATISPPA